MKSHTSRFAVAAAAALTLVVGSSGTAAASPGDLDTTFSGNGKVLTNVSRGFDAASGVAIQADGKVVAAGMAGGSGGRFAVVRYRAGGGLDHSFGGDGKVLTNITRHDDSASDVALQSDGRIVVVGSVQRMRSDGTVVGKVALARYDTDGALDASFGGGDGIVTLRFSPSGLDEGRAVAIQSDGKIVVAGASNADCSCTRFALARFDTDGTLDATFGGDGTVTTRFRSGANAHDVAIAPSGAIVAVGGLVPESGRFDVARYTSDGSLDDGFSGNGKASVNVGRGEEQAMSVAVQADESVVVAGYADVPHEFGDSFFGRFALVRFVSDGTLDPSFGGDGVVKTRFGRQTAAAFGVALQANGRIVAVGTTRGDFALARYQPDGGIDQSFGGDGRVRTDFGTEALAVSVDVRGGKIVAAGLADEQFAVARYLVS